MFKTLIALILTLLVGLSLGMLGSGGSIVMLPVLVYVAAVPAPQAVSMSLAIVGGTSVVGAYLHYRHGNYHWQATVIFSVSGMAGAFLGSTLTHLVSQHVLMLLFSGLMFIVSVAMLRDRPKSIDKRECRPVRCVVIGLGVGVLTGFLGVGGGFLIVPALVLFAGIETNKAVGASLAIIAFNSASGLLGHWRQGSIDWQLTSLMAGVAIVGMMVGTPLASRIPEPSLRKLFARSVLIIAITIAAINVYALLRGVAGENEGGASADFLDSIELAKEMISESSRLNTV